MTNTKLNQSTIIQHLNQNVRDCFDQWLLLKQVTSTNDIIGNELRKFPQKNVVCLAECQTHGRGRLGRTWISPAYHHIYLSLSWHFLSDLSSLQELSILIGRAVIRAIKKLHPSLTIHLKWPNDIFFKDKKLGGILIETQKINNDFYVAIIGMGINVHTYHDKTKSIDQPWTTLDDITHTMNDRNRIVSELLNETCDVLKQFPQERLF